MDWNFGGCSSVWYCISLLGSAVLSDWSFVASVQSLVIVSHIMLVFVWWSLLLTRDVYTDIRDVITELILMGDSS